MKLVCIIIGYLCGNFLTAEVVARSKGLNVREIDPYAKHRGNPGMANVMINIGFKSGVLVFIGDVLKVAIAYLITYLLYKDFSLFMFAGFGALLGHDFPFWYHFNGGKGVLVTLIWLLTIMPIHCWIIFVICGLVVLFTGYLNLAAVLIPLIAIPFAYHILGPMACLLVIVSAIIMILRNKEDIKKLFNGTLDKHCFIKFKKK